MKTDSEQSERHQKYSPAQNQRPKTPEDPPPIEVFRGILGGWRGGDEQVCRWQPHAPWTTRSLQHESVKSRDTLVSQVLQGS